MTAIGRTAVLVCLLMLAACGGGGGGDSSSTNSQGAFTVSSGTVSFAGKRMAIPAAPQTIQLHLTDARGVTKVGAAYRSGVTPASWLSVVGSGAGADYVFTLSVNTTALAAATYSTTITLGSADASDNILHTQDVQVSYTLRDGLSVVPNAQPVVAVAGSSESQQARAFVVSAPAGTQWRATTASPWLTPPDGVQTNGGTFNLTVNTAGMAAGDYSGTIHLHNVSDANDTASVGITLQLAAPSFQGMQLPILIGGDSGLEFGVFTQMAQINTGTNAHPFSVTTSTSTGGNWLSAVPSASSISSANTGVVISANRDVVLTTGTYTGQVQLQATVNGQLITRSIPVTLNYERNRISVAANGVAFSAFPGLQTLTRVQLVRSAWPDPAVVWQATSDQSWLTATAGGTTNQTIQLTANSAMLAVGQYYGNVTIRSSDPRVANEEVIRVGLTVSSITPTTNSYPTITTNHIATNPVDPVAYAITNSGASIGVFNVHTGAALSAITGMFTQAMALTVSTNGRTLYVVDRTSNADRVLAIDATNGAVQSTYPLASQPVDPGIEYFRIDGNPMLLSWGTQESIDLTSGQIKSTPVQGPSVVTSPLWRLLIEHDAGISPSTITTWRMRHTTLNNAGLLLSLPTQNRGIDQSGVRSNGRDLALSYTEELVYAAAGAPYRFDALEVNTLAFRSSLAGDAYPNNAESCWRGQFAGGADNGSASGDIWIYGPDDQLRAQLASGIPRQLFARALKFSGDCTRIVSGAGAGLRIQNVP